MTTQKAGEWPLSPTDASHWSQRNSRQFVRLRGTSVRKKGRLATYLWGERRVRKEIACSLLWVAFAVRRNDVGMPVGWVTLGLVFCSVSPFLGDLLIDGQLLGEDLGHDASLVIALLKLLQRENTPKGLEQRSWRCSSDCGLEVLLRLDKKWKKI